MRGYKRRTSNRQGLIRVTSGDQCVDGVRRRVECEYRSLVFVLVTPLGSDQDLASRAWRQPEREHGPGQAHDVLVTYSDQLGALVVGRPDIASGDGHCEAVACTH